LKIDSSNVATTGKNYPFVFGTPGKNILNRDDDGNLQSTHQFCTPAYLKQEFPFTPNAWLIIAGHIIEAEYVTCIDFYGVESVRAVETYLDTTKNIYVSYVDLYADGGAGFDLSIGQDAKYFVAWHQGGGL